MSSRRQQPAAPPPELLRLEGRWRNAHCGSVYEVRFSRQSSTLLYQRRLTRRGAGGQDVPSGEAEYEVYPKDIAKLIALNFISREP